MLYINFISIKEWKWKKAIINKGKEKLHKKEIQHLAYQWKKNITVIIIVTQTLTTTLTQNCYNYMGNKVEGGKGDNDEATRALNPFLGKQ